MHKLQLNNNENTWLDFGKISARNVSHKDHFDGQTGALFISKSHYHNREKFGCPSSSRLLTMFLIFLLLSSPNSFIGPPTMEWGVADLELLFETDSVDVDPEEDVRRDVGPSDSSCFNWRKSSGRIDIMISCSFELLRLCRAFTPPGICLELRLLLLSLIFVSGAKSLVQS